MLYVICFILGACVCLGVLYIMARVSQKKKEKIKNDKAQNGN